VIAVVLIVVVVAVLGVAALKALAKEHGAVRLAWRYVSGAHLDGRIRTDAGWFTRGTKVLHPTGRASRWAHKPRAHRAGWRLAVPALIVAAAAGYAADAVMTVSALVAAAVTAAALGIWRAVVTVRYRRHNRRVVAPLAQALALPLQSTAPEVERQLHVPLNYQHKDASIRAALPAHWQGTDPQREAVARIIGQRLGGEWITRVARSPLLLVASHPPEPPRMVRFAEVAELIRSEGGPEKILLSIGAGETPMWGDFSSEFAHLGVSCPPGGGKSAFLRFVMAQFAYWGCADFPLIDSKGVSLAGMEAIPGMRVYQDTAEQWAVLAALVADMEERYRILRENRSATFPLRVSLLEEQNDAAIEWRAFWNDHPDRTAKSPATPPVYSDITRRMIKGRQVGERCIAVYQRLSHSACGGIDASVMRDAFGLKALSRFSPQAWDSLTGIRPRPASPTIPGRWVFVLGHVVRSGQVPFGEAEELCDFALSSPHLGIPPSPREEGARPQVGGMSPRGVLHLVRGSGGEDAGGSPVSPEPENGTGDIIGRQAAANFLGMKPETFRKARQNRPIAGEYRLADGRPAWPRESLTRWRADSGRRAGGPSAAAN
jgi:hypothetical protein